MLTIITATIRDLLEQKCIIIFSYNKYNEDSNDRVNTITLLVVAMIIPVVM